MIAATLASVSLKFVVLKARACDHAKITMARANSRKQDHWVVLGEQ
jgi:hypothetical protein